MIAGGCTLQQGLTTEAANIVKLSLSLARHRGHAQVTPLHVASTMLSSSTGLLRTACLQSHASHAHPLQCKALEVCFNVALNRLPACNSNPMFHGGHHSQNPSISNALVAAFKRAQAHQRRGSIESQQQPLLIVKIEVEQLIVSILDDPSVSRVMREAGFSSTHVKSNVEQAVSLEICKSSQTTTTPGIRSIKSNEDSHHMITNLDQVKNEDVESVIENLVKKSRKSIAIVGESLASVEAVVRGVKEKIENGDQHEGLSLKEVKFLTLSLPSFGNLSRFEVGQKLGKLKSIVRSSTREGILLYLGDLKWVTDFRAISSSSHGHHRGYYCPVEHLIMELGDLVCGIHEEGNGGRVWLVGIATFQTYMRCKSGHGHPSLETVWGIHPLTIPQTSLRLSLVTTESELHSESTSKIDENRTSKLVVLEGGESKHLTCCDECSAKFEEEAKSLQGSSSICNSESISSLPAWLQHYKNQNKGLNATTNKHQSFVSVSDLCEKWNSICKAMHHHQQQHSNNSSELKTLTIFSSLSPSSSNSGFSYEQQNPNSHHLHSRRDQHLWIHEAHDKSGELNLTMYSSNPNSAPNSASSSDVMETEYDSGFKEINGENMKTLINALETKVPWQKSIIPEIASTILECRSGTLRRKVSSNKVGTNLVKEETWLFFQGLDVEAKEKVARELACLVFGSQTNNLVAIALSSFSSTRADLTDDRRSKRPRDEESLSYVERFAEAVAFNPHRVFLVEDVDQADYSSQMGFKRAMERGRVENGNGEEVGLGDAIVILSCESFSSRSRACSPHVKRKVSEVVVEDHKGSGSPCTSLDLNISFVDEHVDDDDDDHSIDDIGLLELVDRRIVFKSQEL